MHRACCLFEEPTIKLLFAKGPSLTVRLLVLSVLSAALMLVDARLDTLKPLRRSMAQIVTPLYWLAERPQRIWENFNQQLSSRDELIAENEKLKAEALLMQQRLQKLATLTEQNVRLRELLNSSQLVEDRVLVSELLGVDPNPFTQRLLIDKGEKDGVFVGQPVLDAMGLMGQVVEVMPDASRVLLLTDTTHSVPVQVNRNGLRFIASGTGNSERLELRYVPDTADIKPGDLLVSSGLGQRFPAGYPVATVTEVTHDPSQPFALVAAIPTAHLSRSRYLMLVYSEQHAQAPAVPVPVADTATGSPAVVQPAAPHAAAGGASAGAPAATTPGSRPAAGSSQPVGAAAHPASNAATAATRPASPSAAPAVPAAVPAAASRTVAPARPVVPAPAAAAPAVPRPVVVPGGE